MLKMIRTVALTVTGGCAGAFAGAGVAGPLGFFVGAVAGGTGGYFLGKKVG
jgi:hypothetical protein